MYKKEHDMTKRQKESEEKEKSDRRKAEESAEIACRCKEVSKKTIPEMLKLMIGDLAFWKKKNSNGLH